MARLSDDLRMTNAQYCSNTGGPSAMAVSGYVFQPKLRAPTVLAKTLTLSDGSQPLASASISGAYSMPSDLFLSGSECSDTSCTPAAPAGLPAMGTTAGKRVKGADVLRIRYLSGDGWTLGLSNSSQTCNGSNKLGSIAISPSSSEPPATTFESGDLAMLADCSQSQVFAVTVAGTGSLTVDSGSNYSGANVACVQPRNGGRLFDFNKDFVTVTYYLELKTDDNPDAPSGHLVAVLMRKLNDEAAQPVVRGVEKFDVQYAVEDSLGRTAYLTADDVESGDTGSGGSLACPPQAPNLPPDVTSHCLWGAVKAIEVNLLLDSVDRMPSLPAPELVYNYPPSGASLQSPPTSMTNGLDRQMMRRGFNFVVSVRNYNP